MQVQKLLNDLKEITKQNSTVVENFLTLNEAKLNNRLNDNSWNILECVEHLNRYFKFYIPEIKKQIQCSNYNPSIEFKTGYLGDYFANSMKTGRIKPMKTLKSMNPIHSKLTKHVLHDFLVYQKQLLVLIDLSSKVSLTRTKTAISISKFIKLRLGDTLRVVVYHNQRHIIQAQKIKENIVILK